MFVIHFNLAKSVQKYLNLAKLEAEKLEWIAGMDSAMGAAEHIAGGSCHALHTRYCRGSRLRMRLEYEAVQADQEGSLPWHRQHKRT